MSSPCSILPLKWIGPICRQANEISETCSASPSQPLKPPFSGTVKWQATPSTSGSSTPYVASLSFGLTHLNTVERRKIKSGSSAASAGGPRHSIDASASNIRRPHLVSHRLTELPVMDFSVGEAANYVSAANPRRNAGGNGRGPPFNLV